MWLHKRFLWDQGKDKECANITSKPLIVAHTLLSAMRRDAKTVAGWEFDRIIMCHGVSRPSYSLPPQNISFVTFLLPGRH
jgi:hypothetical protein